MVITYLGKIHYVHVGGLQASVQLAILRGQVVVLLSRCAAQPLRLIMEDDRLDEGGQCAIQVQGDEGGDAANFETEGVQLRGGRDWVDVHTTTQAPRGSSPGQVLASWQVPKTNVIVELLIQIY